MVEHQECEESETFNSGESSDSKPKVLKRIKGLKMASLNADRLLLKLDQVRVFCEESNIDVLAVNETKLEPSVNDHEVRIPDFDVVRRDRNKYGGGVCIYVRNNLNYKIRHDLMPEQLENIVIEIFKPNTVPILISTWYRPPGSSIDIFDSFDSVLRIIDSTRDELYILGDINCNWLDMNPDCHTKRLIELCELYNVSQMITEPTRVTPHSETLLDLCMTTTPEKISQCGVIRCGISDHDIVSMVRKLNHFRINRHRTVQKRCLNHFNQEHFIMDLKNVPWDNIQNASPNHTWEQWKSSFLGVVEKHAPMKKTRLRNNRSPWLSKGIINLIRKRDILKRKAAMSKELNDWNKFKASRNTTNNAIKQAKTKYYKEACSTHKDNPRKLWSAINEVCSRKSRSTTVKSIEIGQHTVTDSARISEAFNEHFSQIGS